MTKNIKNQKVEEPKETVAVIVTESAEESKETVATIATESAEESTVTNMTDDSTKTTETWGIVCNCKKLNVRERPTKKAKVLRILDSDEVILIDTLEARIKGWYKVIIEDGIVGYCMEDFIKIS